MALARAGGGETTFLRTDVTSEDDVTALMDSTVERYGRLDSAFNNAGRDLNVGVADASLEDFSGRWPRQA